DEPLRKGRADAWRNLEASAEAVGALAARSGDRDMADRWAEIRPLLARLRQAQDRVEATSMAGKRDEAAAQLRAEALPVVKMLLDRLDGPNRGAGDHSGGLRGDQQAALGASAELVMQAVRDIDRIQIILLVIGLTLAGIVGFGITRSIAPPLARLTRAIQSLAEGDDEAAITGGERRDEIGEIARAAIELQKVTVLAARAESALANVASSIMVSDAENRIVFCNKSVQELLRRAEADIRRDLPDFDANGLIGQSIDVFHKNPAHQQRILAGLTQAHRARIRIGGRTFNLIANPAYNRRGVRVGTSVEWTDITQQLAIEQEVATIVTAAGNGDFSQRLPLEGKEGFMHLLASGINSLVDTTEQCTRAVLASGDAMERGDLTHRIEADFQGLFGELKANVNSTIDTLRELAGTLATTAAAVRDASAEISSGSK